MVCWSPRGSLLIKNEGPCGFNVYSFADACGAFWVGGNFKQATVNVLRRLADYLEGSKSFTIVPVGPPQATYADAVEAVTFGINGATKYLNELWLDRVHDLPPKPVPILPVKLLS